MEPKKPKKNAAHTAQQIENAAVNVQLARLGKLADASVLKSLADCIEERDPAYPGAFDFQLMRELAAPGNVIAPFNERVTGLRDEQSLGNYVHHAVAFADIATLAQLALSLAANEPFTTEDADHVAEIADLEALELINDGLANLVLGVAAEKALEFDPGLQVAVMKKALKIANSATYFRGTAKEREAAIEKFGRKMHKLSALLSDVFYAKLGS